MRTVASTIDEDGVAPNIVDAILGESRVNDK